MNTAFVNRLEKSEERINGTPAISFKYSPRLDLPEGEWLNEPDVIFWTSKDNNLICSIVRNVPYGILCGYVGLGSKHPLHGKDDPYKGLISLGKFSSLDIPDDVMKDLIDENLWWLGFDCMHSGDLIPKMQTMLEEFNKYLPESKQFDFKNSQFGPKNATYKNVEFVMKKCEIYANQLAKYRAP